MEASLRAVCYATSEGRHELDKIRFFGWIKSAGHSLPAHGVQHHLMLVPLYLWHLSLGLWLWLTQRFCMVTLWLCVKCGVTAMHFALYITH